ncbi:cell division protein FtsZ [Candidatus Micrarchaeota archaeon]|nr:cell division protein FtsZ [Candidatus Micrarchaeota archaeon]
MSETTKEEREVEKIAESLSTKIVEQPKTETSKKEEKEVEKIAASLPTEDITDDDAELLRILEESKPKIVVIGTGGSGSNTLNRMVEMGITGASFIAMNTDVRHLLKVKADKKLLLGKKTTRGLGAGSNPDVGEAAAKESGEELRKIIGDASLVFITCGLGGGTGTGSAHVIAEQAKAVGALTIAVVTLPFLSEGFARRKNALEGLEKLKKQADTTIVIPNDKLLRIVPDLPLDTAFKVSDEVLASSVKGITELVTKAGLVNLDYADLRTILGGAGCAVIGMGESSIDTKPEQRALVAIETALTSPLLDVEIANANKALINVIGAEDMTLREAELMVSEVSKRIAPDAHIIWGARVEGGLARNSLRVLVVIAGAKLPQYEKEAIQQVQTQAELDLEYV